MANYATEGTGLDIPLWLAVSLAIMILLGGLSWTSVLYLSTQVMETVSLIFRLSCAGIGMKYTAEGFAGCTS